MGGHRIDGRQPIAASVHLHRRIGRAHLLRHGRRLHGYTTKRDLTAMGEFLFMGVIGLILASHVNMLWPSGTMSFIISAAGVLIFSGLIAYDTQKIKEQFAGAWGTDPQEELAIFSAPSLYINFVNLFQFLMMFMDRGAKVWRHRRANLHNNAI
jgi:FtsH-binding integral membrane protein